MNDKVAVIGIGRLGLCFALNLASSGFEVFGFDVNEDYIVQLQDKSFRSNEPDLEAYLQQSKSFHAATDLSIIDREGIEVIFVLVPTPSLPDGTFSYAYIGEVAEKLKQLQPSAGLRHVVIGCTTMPGHCDTLADDLSPHGYTVSYNPEFIAQGSIIRDQQHPDQILIGEGHPDATVRLREIYARLCRSNPEIHVMSRKSAEISKLATNCFLTMKISFANAIGDLALSAGAEPEKILGAIGSDSRIGSKYLKYGFGFGGPCFPRDNQALIAHAQQQGQTLYLSEATVRVNDEHLDFQLAQLLEEDRESYVFDSVSYKKGTDILEESQQLKLALLLVERGKEVVVKDSFGVQDQLEEKYPGCFRFLS